MLNTTALPDDEANRKLSGQWHIASSSLSIIFCEPGNPIRTWERTTSSGLRHLVWNVIMSVGLSSWATRSHSLPVLRKTWRLGRDFRENHRFIDRLFGVVA